MVAKSRTDSNTEVLHHVPVNYELTDAVAGEGFNIPSLIPGIDLLSDQFRCNASLLVGALHYVSETLVRHKYAIQVCAVVTKRWRWS